MPKLDALRTADGARLARCSGALLVLLALLTLCSEAAAQIHSPGRHVRYSAELEPHLVWQWTNDSWWSDDGIGLGFRASIPVIENGPLKTINNSLAVGFGLDWAHFDGSCGNFWNDCDSNQFWLPLVVQWNFFVSESISLFPELGLAIQHSRLDWDGPLPGPCVRIRGSDFCGSGSTTDTDLELVLWFGARFLLSDEIALTARLGVPSLLLGVSFLL